MEDWYWDINEIKNSPSFKAGIDHATETRYRTEGSKFISTVGQQLKLRYITLATGTVYFHRFYMYHSFKEFHRYAIASACLFLAGKVEETPKKARDLFKHIQASGLITEQAMPSVFGDDPKEALMTLERILLKTIKFDLQVDHPYKFMLKYAKTFLGDRSKIEKVVQMGWTFINDSLCTTLCIQWEPEIVAIALTDLSCRISKYEIADWNGKAEGYKGKWWDQFVADVSVELLESICHQVLDFYSTAAPSQQARPSSSASSSAKPSSEPAKRTTTESAAQPPAKAPRLSQPVQVTTAAAPAAPASTQPGSYHQAGSLPSHAYPPPTTYPPQPLPPQTTLSTALPPQPGYPAPPPGYPQAYHAPPLPGQPPAVVYQHTGQQYYTPPPGIPPQAQYYGGQPPPAPAPPAPYPQVAQPGYQQYPPPQQQRRSTLKVIDVRPSLT